MDVEKKPYRKSFGWVAAAAVLASTSLLEQAVRADQLQWSLMIAQAAAGASVAQADTEPEAIFTITPEPPVIGVPFRVDASQSFDRPSNGPIVNYLWNWGDRSPITSGVSVEHTYAQSGQYTITLTVFDADSQPHSDTATKTVTIASSAPPPGGVNRTPTASLTISPAEGTVDDDFRFDASESRDADSDPLAYRFNFGDGNETDFASGAIVTHQYDQAGSYVVRLTVRDDKNASTDITNSVLVLNPNEANQPPVALIVTGQYSGTAPVTLEFDGRISYDPEDGEVQAYNWSFYHGGELLYDDQSGAVLNQLYDSQSGADVTQLFDQPGTYSVVLEVTDSNGTANSSSAETVTITEGGTPVEPPPPAPVPQPEPPPPSYTQRPPKACGAGILLPMLASLMGLMGTRRDRRARR